jgi:hypothetical protein
MRTTGFLLTGALAALVACGSPRAPEVPVVAYRPAEPPRLVFVAGASGASCSATLACYRACEASDHLACMASCDRRATPGAFHATRTLLDCLVANNCGTQMCAEHSCGDELGLCGLTLAVVTEPLVSERGAPPR